MNARTPPKPAPHRAGSLAAWLQAAGEDAGVAFAAEALAGEGAQTKIAPVEAELLATLYLLESLDVDRQTQAACVLHEMSRHGVALDAARLAKLPASLRDLLEGQQAAGKVGALYAAHGVGNAEGLRRLLLAIVRDLRVVFILLAQALARLRAAGRLQPDERHALARLVADIHAPLANRLGIWQLKWELEDLAFSHLQPDTYRRIARLVDEHRSGRAAYIEQAIRALRRALGEAHIRADIAGRAKHNYSIWRKMQRKGGDFGALYDIRALRVLVDEVADCYAALGAVHSLWPPLPSEFDDYIARPKGNQYQSLHTAVIGPEGKTLEVQIRTHQMHAYAERGVAAHWRYKEGGGGDVSFERKIAWMRELLDAKEEAADERLLLAGLKTDLIEDRVYLLTPAGQVMDLPRGASVLDFAYAVHTELGHRTRGAKVEGRIVPLGFQPSSGDRVEILAGKLAAPRRDWMSAQAGFLNTQRARAKVRAWFKRIDQDANLAAGREILEREFRRLAIRGIDWDALPAKFQHKSLDEFLIAIALGDLSAGHVARLLHEEQAPARERTPPRRAVKRDKDAVVIEGVGNLLTTMARCCQPLPGDAIVGYVTRGKGVSIHRADCASHARLVAREAGRAIEVFWGSARSASYEVDLLVRGYDRKGLHKDVTGVIAGANADLIAVQASTDEAGLATMRFTARVADFEQLSALLGRIAGVPNVIEARRLA